MSASVGHSVHVCVPGMGISGAIAMFILHPIFCECIVCPLLPPPVVALQYVMYVLPVLWMTSCFPTIIDFPNLGSTYNGGWCSATISR